MLRIYGHPFASFYWKALIALYERDVPFEFMMVDPEHPENAAAVARLAPTGQFPVLVDGERTVIESAAIIEYLDLHHGKRRRWSRPIASAAIEARQMDSVFDDYVMAPLSRMVFNGPARRRQTRSACRGARSKATLDKSYAWLNGWMTGREWAANDAFGIADCAAAPALFYAHWGFPIPEVAYGASRLSRAAARSALDCARRRRGAPLASDLPAQGPRPQP